MLTATDVEQKTFSTALRGYDLDEVDDFLDEVVATIRDLNEKIEEAKSAQPAAPVPAPEPMPEPEAEAAPEPAPAEERVSPALDESAVGRALIAAQTAADKLLEEAETEASRILEDAQVQADSWETEKEAKKAQAQAEMATLAERVRAVRSELAVLAEQVSGKLDDMDSVIASGGVEDSSESDDETGDDSGDDVNQVTVLHAEAPDDDHDEAETGADDTDTANGGDHLDQILTGVAADLQLGESDEDDSLVEESEEDSDEGSDEDEDR